MNPDATFYCGDCAGRKFDRTDTDYKFALNCVINFKTPEDVFEGKLSVIPKINYPVLPGLNDEQHFTILNSFKPANKEIIIMIGYQGSGKSFLSKEISKKFGYAVINQDMLKTKQKCMALVKGLINNQKNIIIDSTNPDKKSRELWIDIAKNNKYTTRAILMTTAINIAKHNNHYRNLTTNCKLVPSVAYNIYKSKYQEPVEAEGFLEIIKSTSRPPEDFSYYYYMF